MSKTKDKIQVFHFDLYGKREAKYDFLNENSLSSIAWNELEPNEPNFFFVKKDDTGVEEYEKGFKLDELFPLNASGLTTERDSITIQFDDLTLNIIINDFKNLNVDELRSKYDKKPDGRDWKYQFAINDISNHKGLVTKIQYRPFDFRQTYYTGKSKGFMAYPRNEIMSNFLKPNIGLIFKRGFDNDKSAYGFITKTISDRRGWSSPGMQGAESIAPLYLYPKQKSQLNFEQETGRVPNLNMEIVQKIADGLGLKFEAESISPFEGGQRGITQNLKQEKSSNSPLSVSPQGEKASDPVSIERGSQFFCPIDILDYIYAVLHSPSYREQYKEFLKIDFPRVPYPTDVDKFWNLVELGGKLRELHLLESSTVNEFITEYQGEGDNVVGKPRFEVSLLEEGLREVTQIGRVHINENQYFDNVPESAWNFYIGGYQPAQKWLKDRKERELNFEDILHYQKIIVALTETSRIMGEIDEVGV
jgi:predicted helicase